MTLLAALALAGCGESSSTPVSDAFCADLRAGASMVDLAVEYADEPGDVFAELAYGHAKISCPDELRTNTELRTLLEAWGFNPDA